MPERDRKKRSSRRPAVTGSARRQLRADHTHDRSQRRIAKVVADRLSQVLSFDETVLHFTEGIAHCDMLSRAVLGAFWASSRRVALVFTAHRMIEIGLSPTGRRAAGRIRSFPWDRVPGLELRGRWLELRSWADASFRWYLRDELDPSIQQLLRAQADLSVSTYQPSQIRSVPMHHCSRCGVAAHTPGGACSRCQAEVRSPRFASWLAIAFPGAGHLYASRPLAAAVRFLCELLIYGLLAAAVLVADTTRGAVTVIAIGSFVIFLLKLHGGAAARILSQQADAITAESRRRWRLVIPVGLVLSAAALIAPIPFSGSADGDISWDLDFVHTDPAMIRLQSSSPPGADAGWSARSRWLHPDGWQLRVDASPLRPFEPIGSAWQRISEEIGGSPETVRIGAHEVMWGSDDTAASGREITTIRLAVLDREGRDVHLLSADVDSSRAAFAHSRLEHVLRTGIWVNPRLIR